MPGTTEEALHVSMKNTLKQNSLWLTSDELSAKQKDVIGWIQNDNSTYTHPQGQATTIQDATTTTAVANPEVAALVAKIKGEQFIFRRSGKIYRNKAVGEGIQILTTNNNFGCVMQLIGTLQPNSISLYYQITSKIVKREMNSELYDG